MAISSDCVDQIPAREPDIQYLNSHILNLYWFKEQIGAQIYNVEEHQCEYKSIDFSLFEYYIFLIKIDAESHSIVYRDLSQNTDDVWIIDGIGTELYKQYITYCIEKALLE